MPLDSFTGDSEDSSGGPPKTTYYQFENPDHPDSKEFDDPEAARERFEAARYIQKELKTVRHELVGDFLIAVQALEKNDDPEPLQELVETLTE